MTNNNEAPESTDTRSNLSWYQSLNHSFEVHRKLSWSQSLAAMAPRLRFLTVVMVILLIVLNIMIWFQFGRIFIGRHVH